MKFEAGDTVRLKASLKRGDIYGFLVLLRSMDVRPYRLKIVRVDDDDTAFCRLESDVDSVPMWYNFDMLDKRTLRKGTK